MRRAWVEIGTLDGDVRVCHVALHAEGVGRNMVIYKKQAVTEVALHAEGVGRNNH